MVQETILAEIQNASALVEWFDFWPSFHDAEVLSILLKREGESCVKVHAFAGTSDLDASGHYVCIKHVTVNFLLEGVSTVQLDGFNNQNVISGLGLEKRDDGYELKLYGCYGVEGWLVSNRVRLVLEPGIPQGSQYAGGTELK